MVAVNNFGDTRSGGLAGPMGLFIIVLMCVATVLLIRNMNRRVRRLPDSFPDTEAARRDAEIARLDAELSLPDAQPSAARVDDDQSDVAGVPPEAEVKNADETDRTTADRSREDRG